MIFKMLKTTKCTYVHSPAGNVKESSGIATYRTFRVRSLVNVRLIAIVIFNIHFRLFLVLALSLHSSEEYGIWLLAADLFVPLIF